MVEAEVVEVLCHRRNQPRHWQAQFVDVLAALEAWVLITGEIALDAGLLADAFLAKAFNYRFVAAGGKNGRIFVFLVGP